MNNSIFVFGSNLAGRHGAGAALFARKKHGAIYGQGEGRQGNSYAIPTKASPYVRLSLSGIEWYVNRFIQYAIDHPEETFEVTKIGCGLAGYKEENIVPMFANAPENCILPDGWKILLPADGSTVT